ncbi:hypothetical protein NC651_018247 [Populus alba x Populus x berolinensis]|nr:hypothetical protein NC651_018247 [Populus alba x Populus x berolinensis]
MLAATGFKSTGDHTAFDNGVENRDTLTPKATGLSYFKESLIIAERFLGVHIYSGLMIKDNMKDGERVLYEIANAAQKMSNAAWDNTGSVSFFVEILSKYLYFFEKGNAQITGAAIQSLIELITTEMQSDNSTPDPAADAFLSRTPGYIQFQKQKGGANGEKYDPIKRHGPKGLSHHFIALLKEDRIMQFKLGTMLKSKKIRHLRKGKTKNEKAASCDLQQLTEQMKLESY